MKPADDGELWLLGCCCCCCCNFFFFPFNNFPRFKFSGFAMKNLLLVIVKDFKVFLMLMMMQILMVILVIKIITFPPPPHFQKPAPQYHCLLRSNLELSSSSLLSPPLLSSSYYHHYFINSTTIHIIMLIFIVATKVTVFAISAGPARLTKPLSKIGESKNPGKFQQISVMQRGVGNEEPRVFRGEKYR